MENYFRDALQNFIFEEAGGGAIRHLADRGYTARQTADALSFPMPYEKVREAYTKHLLDCGVLLKEKPAEHKRPEKTEYVREYDKYGRPSFRRVAVKAEEGAGQESTAEGKYSAGVRNELSGTGEWKEMDLSEFLLLYKNGAGGIKLPAETEHREAERNIYIACGFKEAGTAEKLQVLDQRQQEYIQGICWMRRTMYHLLDERMLGIAVKLQEAEQADGAIGKIYIRH